MQIQIPGAANSLSAQPDGQHLRQPQHSLLVAVRLVIREAGCVGAAIVGGGRRLHAAAGLRLHHHRRLQLAVLRLQAVKLTLISNKSDQHQSQLKCPVWNSPVYLLPRPQAIRLQLTSSCAM